MKLEIMLSNPEEGVIDLNHGLPELDLYEVVEINGGIYYQTCTSCHYGDYILIKLAGEGHYELSKSDIKKLANEDGLLHVKYYQMECGMVGR